jgi:hypothetical protein
LAKDPAAADQGVQQPTRSGSLEHSAEQRGTGSILDITFESIEVSPVEPWGIRVSSWAFLG